MSPEANVPILNQNTKESRLGGAANVALNLSAMGGKVILAGVIGDDQAGKELLDLVDNNDLENLCILDKDRITTEKTRILRGDEQLIRIDNESTADLDTSIESSFIEKLPSPHDVDGLVLSDYNKGVLTSSLIEKLMNRYVNIPIYVDPKKDNFWDYKGVTIFKPNEKELSSIQDSPLSDETILEASTRLDCLYLTCTRGEKGILYSKDNNVRSVATTPLENADVCGAGDTAMAALVVGHQIGLEDDNLMRFANEASRLVCTRKGVSIISNEDLKNISW